MLSRSTSSVIVATAAAALALCACGRETPQTPAAGSGVSQSTTVQPTPTAAQPAVPAGNPATSQQPPATSPRPGNPQPAKGARSTVTGLLNWMAPGKYRVTADSGGLPQAAFITDDATVLSAMLLCPGPSGSKVTVDSRDRGTAPCTVDSLEQHLMASSGVRADVTLERTSSLLLIVKVVEIHRR
jgi:hypothetical protein